MFTDILWDFDGTLFDTYPGTVKIMLQALRDEGIEEDYDDAMGRMQKSISEAISHYIDKYSLGRSFTEKLGRSRREMVRPDVRLFPHAAKMIRAIYRSEKRNYLYTHRGFSAIEYLEMHSLIDYFSDCITYEDGFPMKPSPDAILHLINTHGIKKENAVMIGDREIDILAAKNAGIYGCFFFPDESVTCEIADYTVRSLLEIAPIIGIEL